MSTEFKINYDMSEYYTYIYYDPLRNWEPMYVGKGKDDRALVHLALKCNDLQS